MRLKVIQILPELNAGGVEKGTLEIARALVAEGHQSIVISNGGKLVNLLETGGSRHIQLPVHRKHPLSLLQVRPLRNLFAAEKPDIIHARSRVPAWLAWLAWRKMNPAERPRFITTVHGLNSINFYSQIMTRGERVIAVSETARTFILRNYPKTNENNIIVIPRGIRAADIRPGYQPSSDWLLNWNKAFPQLNRKTLLLLPGRVTRLKGHPDFIQLIHNLKTRGHSVHGLIVGDIHRKKNDYLHSLQEQISRLNLEDDITFIDHRNDLTEIMAISHIVFNLSQKPEAFGRTVLEALSIGKPVLAYDHGGAAEQLHHIFPEGLVPMNNPESLSSKTIEILSTQPKPKTIPPEYTLEQMCRSTLATYKATRI